MDEDQLRNIIAALPEKLSRSRLEPYRQLIGELRRRRRTYREIARILGEKCDLRISAKAVHNFVRLHLCRRPIRYKRPPASCINRPEIGPNKVRTSAAKANDPSAAKANDPEREGPAGDEEVCQRIAELKQRSLPAEQTRREFHYNRDEPLHLLPQPERHKSEDEQ